ncbi:MAG: hypothetical protein L3J20_10365 [Flavobacteriaceae bacterium]|nr:hypothetical protein [Flavobacteriaceae bacterium]
MEDEYLKELDSILKLSLIEASTFSKSSIPNVDNRFMLSHNFKNILEGNNADISKILYEIDLDQNGFTKDSIQSYLDSISRPQPQPVINAEDFYKKINGGFQVYNGSSWLQVSDKANIKITYLENGNDLNNHKPAVRIEVNDVKTDTYFVFEDTDLTTTGNEFLFSGQLSPNDDLAGGLPSREIYWEDPMYNSMKSGIGTAGLVAGALELRQVGNLTP